MKLRTKEILKTTTFKRLWNMALLKTSFHLATLLKKPIHWGKPMALSIEPTTTCNLKCPQCPSGLRQFTRATGNLDVALNKKILDQVGGQLQHINYYFQGEPFIHPQFLDLVKDARKRNIYVVTSTNAHFITAETAEEIVLSDLSEIIISIDGLTQETYEQYRINGKLAKVIAGTTNLMAAKQKLNRPNPIVTFQFLVTKHNEHEIEQLHALGAELGVNEVRLKSVQVYDYETGNDLIPENEQYSRYKKTATNEYVLKNKFKNKCWRMWSSCVFTWDGKIVPCCFDKDAKHQLGDLKAEDFKKTWKSAIYKEFRSKVLRIARRLKFAKTALKDRKFGFDVYTIYNAVRCVFLMI